MERKKEVALFSSIYFIVYVAFGLTYCLMISYLISLGYSATQRSYMYAFGAIVGMVSQFGLGFLCDRFKTIKRFVYLISIIYVLASISLYTTDFFNLGLHIIIAAANIALLRLLMGALDSWCLESSDNLRENYGFARAFGSVGWAIGSAIASKIVEGLGYSYIGYFFTGFIMVAMIICSLAKDAEKKASEPVDLKAIGKLLSNKCYMLLIIIFFFVFMMQVALDYTVVDKMDILGASSSDISFYWSLAAMVELPLFFLGSAVIKRFGVVEMMIVSIVAYSLRFVIYGFSNSIQAVMLATLLQTITFPIMQIVLKRLIDDESPANLKSSGLQIGLALFDCTSSFLSPLVAGRLEESFGINVALFTISGFGIVALIFTAIYMKEKSKKQLQNNKA